MGTPCPGVGCPGLGALPPPAARPSGRRPGPAARFPWAQGVWAWGPVTSPQRALLRAGFARCGGGTRAPGGEAPLPSVWGVQGWALSHARPPVLGVCGRGPLPTGFGCGGHGPGDPSPTPQRALLQAGFAHCGGGTMVPGGGASCLGVAHQGLGALQSLTARPWGVRPGRATHWLCVRKFGRGDLLPAPQRALVRAGFARCGGGTRAPGGQASPASVWGVQAWALSLTRLPVLRASGRGLLPHLPSVGGVGAGTRHQPHNARSCELVLRAVGAAQGRPCGGGVCLGVGSPGLGALPHPTARSFDGRPRPHTHRLWLRGVWAWGPVSNPTARALASWLSALWGRHEGAWGAAPLAWLRGVRGWALSHARPPLLGVCGRGPLPTRCGRGVRLWGPGFPWHLLPCGGSSCVVRAFRVCGTRWPLLLGTGPCALALAGSVPLWRA